MRLRGRGGESDEGGGCCCFGSRGVGGLEEPWVGLAGAGGWRRREGTGFRTWRQRLVQSSIALVELFEWRWCQ